ncbi:hypothetical protein SSX86_021639 [Deinandra increscens subsp. villosa]|uniref:F-box domain-containing protein n=1 Tax=Deinandra increscens subsp. villosa TaxID=3103831 RepID=A0AAP0CLN6_9ASTR
MDKLPHSLLLHILSRLDDSADVARCRVASKAFNVVFPGLRSVNLRCSEEWYRSSRSRVSKSQPDFKTVFLDLISKRETVESVCIALPHRLESESDDFYLTSGDFAMEWLPRVSSSLKSLSICDRCSESPSIFLQLISAYCHNLAVLKLKSVWLSVDMMKPMPMLTSLRLAFVRFEDDHLNELNKCLPNLQILDLIGVSGLTHPKIHHLNLKCCIWAANKFLPSLTLITPNLIVLRIDCLLPASLHVEAPMLSWLHFSLILHKHGSTLTFKKFENLKTLQLSSPCIANLISEFPIIKTVKNLTLDLEKEEANDTIDSIFTLRKVFTVFPNVSSLRIKSDAWLELEVNMNPRDWEILDGRKGLKTICVYLVLTDPLLTFSNLASVLDQCEGLLEASLLIRGDVGTVSQGFMIKCMARWPGLKWRWGIWSEGKGYFFITDN